MCENQGKRALRQAQGKLTVKDERRKRKIFFFADGWNLLTGEVRRL